MKIVVHAPSNSNNMSACGKRVDNVGWCRDMITCEKCKKTQEYKDLPPAKQLTK